MEIADYLRILRRRWMSVLACVVVLGAVALAYTLAQTKMYASNTTLFISTGATNDSSVQFQSGQYTQDRVQSYVNLVTSRDLASKVIEAAGLDLTPTELAKQVSADTALNTVNITITAKDADPHAAQKIAQAYAEQMVDMVRQLETPPGTTQPTIKATIIDNASFDDDAVSPKLPLYLGAGLVLGLLIGVGQAVLRETLDTRITSTDDLAQIIDRPLLGAIGFDTSAKDKPLLTDIDLHSPRAEAFRVLRTNLQFVDVDHAQKVYVISSSVPSEGKTTTAVNLAISLAQAGARTLLIEGDLRRPRAAVRLGLDGIVGVTNVLVGKVKLEDAIQVHHDSKLDFLASGPIPPNPAELLQSKAMADMLAALRERYDVVLIDAPPLLPVTDAALIASHADGAIVVVRHGKATRDQVKLSRERLEQVDARLVGVVLNMAPAKGRGYGYGYGYGYAPDQSADRTMRVS